MRTVPVGLQGAILLKSGRPADDHHRMSTVGWERSVSSPQDVAVQAHILLNRFSAVAGRAATLRAHWDRLDPELRSTWLGEMERTAVDAGLLFQHLALGLPLDMADPYPLDQADLHRS